MKTVGKTRPVTRLVTVLALVAVFLAGFVYFWEQAGGPTPNLGAAPYRVSFLAGDVKNLKDKGDVSIAGVVVGHVEGISLEGGSTRVTMNLSGQAAPLHQGATVRVGVKGVIGTSYVDVVDGAGPSIAGGATLPAASVKPAVDIDELLATLDQPTRDALQGTLRSLGPATHGTADDTAKVLTGLGDLGRDGYTALDAIAAQSDDLVSLTQNTTKLLNTLDTGRGQIADVVRDSDRLTQATAGQRQAVEDTMRGLPPLLTAARNATGKLGELSQSLAPVASDLRRAAPDLNEALLYLPQTTGSLRGLLPALDATLQEAPSTLDRVPPVAADVSALAPGAQAMLADLNPALAYLKPYGRDIGSMFANFGASMDIVAENGLRPVRLAPVFDSAAVRGLPLSLSFDPLHWNNPYPQPGAAGDPTPFQGPYPQVRRAGQ